MILCYIEVCDSCFGVYGRTSVIAPVVSATIPGYRHVTYLTIEVGAALTALKRVTTSNGMDHIVSGMNKLRYVDTDA
jgi:hypothetical protein